MGVFVSNYILGLDKHNLIWREIRAGISSEYNLILKEVLAKRRIVISREEYRVIWCTTKSSEYTVKLGYEVQRGNLGDAGYGAIIRNHEGKMCFAIMGFIGSAMNNEAEFIALEKGLDLCRRLGISHVEIGDSQLVINSIEKSHVMNWRLKQRLSVVMEALVHQVDFSINHILREGNMAEDWLANEGINFHKEETVLEGDLSPEDLIIIIKQDMKQNKIDHIGFQVGSEFVAQAFWPEVADQIYDISLSTLETPLSLFFGQRIEEEGDSSHQGRIGEDVFPISTMWSVFKDCIQKQEFSELCRKIFSDKTLF
ncbi:hypothetical protein SUGI_1175370 [Cryptomeria japonica]|nr:hypothetical protein SUGI_1175370 [Cryptomeria japonica]